MDSKEKLKELIQKYQQYKGESKSTELSEEETRSWINQFLGIFDWDVLNTKQIKQEKIIDENQKQISILKVMGYCENEISKMVLTIYFPFVMIAYLLSIPLTRAGVDYIMTLIASELPMAIPTDFTMAQTIIGGLTVMMTYLIAMKCSKVQLDKISLHEVLKY